MTATYTFDVFSSLDGFAAAGGDWTGYWGKQGPELLDHRLALFDQEQRMVFGANTYRLFAEMFASSPEEAVGDPWVTRMHNLPATVISSTLQGPLDWPKRTKYPRGRRHFRLFSKVAFPTESYTTCTPAPPVSARTRSAKSSLS